MNDQPYVSRVLTLAATGRKQYAVEAVVDNPTSEVVWVDQIELDGKIYHEVFYSGGLGYLNTVTYKVQLDYELMHASESGASVKLTGHVFESEDEGWSYIASGEFSFSQSNPPGEIWEYKVGFPVMLEVPPKGRSVIRLLIATPSKSVIMKYRGRVRESHFLGGRSFARCAVRMLTSDGRSLEKEMDESFWHLLANTGNTLEQQPERTAIERQTQLRSLLDIVDDQKEIQALCLTLGIDYDLLNDGDSIARTKKLLSGLYSQGKLPMLAEHLQSKKPPVVRILFLAANPIDTNRLRLDEEVRTIDEALRKSKFRDRFDIQQQWAVRTIDIQGCFLRYGPNIVHFSGHGSKSGEIILEDDTGRSRPLRYQALSRLFSVLKDNIQCVVLNACYSKKQARAIAEHVDCVIGNPTTIGDSAAISFARAFYQALGYGRDVKTAFDLGCLQIDLDSLAEQDKPYLSCKNRYPQEMVFVHGN